MVEIYGADNDDHDVDHKLMVRMMIMMGMMIMMLMMLMVLIALTGKLRCEKIDQPRNKLNEVGQFFTTIPRSIL